MAFRRKARDARVRLKWHSAPMERRRYQRLKIPGALLFPLSNCGLYNGERLGIEDGVRMATQPRIMQDHEGHFGSIFDI